VVNASSLRLVFFGTPAFAAPTLDALLHSRHSVVGVVTRQDRARGRGQKTSATPVKAQALAAGIPVLQPERLSDPEFLATLNGLAADLGIVAAYGKILTDAVLAMPRLGLLNVHASLLPRYRGAAPVHRAVIEGEQETGVTIMRMVKALDAGPMLATARRAIGPNETSEEIERDLSMLGAPLLVSMVDALSAGPVPEVPQDDRAATYARRITREDGIIDWTRSAEAIHDLIRGLHPWPHTSTYHRGKRLILLRSEKGSGGFFDSRGEKKPPDPFSVPGTIVGASGDRLWVATGDGVIAITELQAEGRRPMTAREFLAGHRMTPGDLLTSEP
jgi:methionyl-tRNA formyltransferase